MKNFLKIFTIGIIGAMFITSCSQVETVKTAYNAYTTYKNTKESIKGYQNWKNIGSLTRIKPVFYPYKSVKVEVQLKNVEGRDNQKIAQALKENIKYDLTEFFKDYGMNDKKVCETDCEEPYIIVRFKERSYKSVLQKWALKGKYGGKIQYIDGKTGKVLLEDEIGNKETFYDVARAIGEVLEIKVYRSGIQPFLNDKQKAKEYQEKYGKNLQNRESGKYVNKAFEKILKNT